MTRLPRVRLRDEAASLYSSVFILHGLRPEVVERVPDAFRRLVAAPDARSLRRRWQGDAGSRHLSPEEAVRVADRNVHRADPAMPTGDLLGMHHRLGFDVLPLSIVIAGDRVSIKTWHADLDGAAMLDLLHRLVELACGLPDAPFPARVRFPVLRAAVRSIAPVAIREALAVLRSREQRSEPAPAPTAEQRDRVGVQLRGARLEGPLVERIRRAGTGDASVNARLIALVAETLAAIQHDDADPAVLVPVHLGPWAGGRVAGNFIIDLRMSGLRSMAWTPEVVQRRIAEMQGRVGIGQYLWDLQWPLKARLRRRPTRAGSQGEFAVQISAIRSPRPFPAQAWLDGEPLMTFGTINPFPACYTMLWRCGDAVLLAFDEETGRFDADRFLPELERRIAAFVGAPDEPVLRDAGVVVA
jgi:hypothetical protein